MKASQSSLYREIENLMLWFIPVGNNIPKDFALRQLGDRMLNEMTDALKRKLFGKLKYFWKCCYLEGRFNKVTLRKRYRLSEFLLKENDLLNL